VERRVSKTPKYTYRKGRRRRKLGALEWWVRFTRSRPTDSDKASYFRLSWVPNKW